MDSLEGYNGPGAPGNLYERVVQEVELAGGERVLAYLYIWVSRQHWKSWELLCQRAIGEIINGK